MTTPTPGWWAEGRIGVDMDPVTDALVALQVNVIESLIGVHRAATVSPGELSRCACGNRAAGKLEEGAACNPTHSACRADDAEHTRDDMGRGVPSRAPRPSFVRER